MKGKDSSKAERDRTGSSANRKTEEANAHPLEGLQDAIGNQAVADLISNEGSSVPDEVRRPFEASLGRGFSRVRIHEGPEVDSAAERLEATAFTSDQDVFLHSDAPALNTLSGKALLGEELAHVAQGVGSEQIERVTSPEETVEAEAKGSGLAALAGDVAPVSSQSSAAHSVARQEKGVLEEIEEFIGDLFGGGEEPAQEARTGVGAAGQSAAQEAAEEEQRRAAEEEARRQAEEEAQAQAEEQQLEQEAWEESAPPMPEDQIERLQAGIVPKLEMVISGLVPGDKKSLLDANKIVKPLIDFAMSFVSTAGRHGDHVTTIAANITAGHNAIATLTTPEGVIRSQIVANIQGIEGRVRDLAAQAKEPETDEEGEELPRDHLTPAEGAQLRAGVGAPLAGMRNALMERPPNYDLAKAQLEGWDQTVFSFGGAPPAVLKKIEGIYISKKLLESALEALTTEDDQAVIDLAKGHFRAAITAAQSMSLPLPEPGELDGINVLTPSGPPAEPE